MSSDKYRDVVGCCRWCDFRLVLKQQTEITTIPLSWTSNDRLYICPLLVRCPTGLRLPVNCHICSTSTPSLLPSVYTTRLPLSELQSAGIGRCDGSPEKISMSNENKKKLCEGGKKRQYRKCVFSCRFQKHSSNLWIFCYHSSWLWLIYFICFKGLCMYPSASIDRFASLDCNSASFLYNKWSSLKT